jgi:hypothetical protein
MAHPWSLVSPRVPLPCVVPEWATGDICSEMQQTESEQEPFSPCFKVTRDLVIAKTCRHWSAGWHQTEPGPMVFVFLLGHLLQVLGVLDPGRVC